MDMGRQAQILNELGFRETARATKASWSTIKRVNAEIMKLEPPKVRFAIPGLGSLAQGLLAPDSDVEFASMVTSRKNLKKVDNWTHQLATSLRLLGLPVQKERCGKDALGRPFEGLEGHCHCCTHFMRTDTSKPRIHAIYKANLVPILCLSYPLYETAPGLARSQIVSIWKYIEETRGEESLPYFYNLLIQEYYTSNREGELKRLKLERDKTVRSIVVLHLSLFGSRSVGEFKVPAYLIKEISEELPTRRGDDLSEASIAWFDNYFRLRKAIVAKTTESLRFLKWVHEFLAAQQRIRDLSHEWARRRGWPLLPLSDIVDQ